jgi:hypothetical protein
MQTFLPYEDFTETAKVLDYKRLGKQRVEAFQILNVLNKKSMGFANHPAVKMWENYIPALTHYYNIMIIEWVNRGYKNNMPIITINDPVVYPWWMGNENFHRAMRSRLIEKFPEFYEPKFPEDKGFNDGKYLWPVNETRTFRHI